MKVSHYFEWERWITGGHAQSVRNQRTILERNGIEYTTRPDLSAGPESGQDDPSPFDEDFGEHLAREVLSSVR